MIPTNEQGVVVLFSQQAEEAGFEIVSIQTSFPDAIVRRGDTTYRVEFEYKASNFVEHEHDPKNCDLIIAWKSDWPECILPVLALSEFDWASTDLTLPSESEREIFYWRYRALAAERALARARSGEYTDMSVKEVTAGTPRGGRPVTQICPEKIGYYLRRGPKSVTRLEAKEDLALKRYAHYKHRDLALGLLESFSENGLALHKKV